MAITTLRTDRLYESYRRVTIGCCRIQDAELVLGVIAGYELSFAVSPNHSYDT